MQVLIALDKFRDALGAPAACDAVARALRDRRPDWQIECCPLADGGEGFASILTAAAGGTWQTVETVGPRGDPLTAGFGRVRVDRLPPAARHRLALPAGAGHLAVVEMAAASGLQHLTPDRRDPWSTDSRGTGRVLRAAVAAGADVVLLGVGGSATHDLGLGVLAEWGWSGQDAEGNLAPLVPPSAWSQLARLQVGGPPLPPLRIACDVRNPLLGPRGAAHVFAPQKGALPDALPRLEAATARMARLLGDAVGCAHQEDVAGAGAAGGMAFGLLTAARAHLVPGFDLVEEWLDLAAKVARADLIITGEGRFDTSSLEGKGPGSLVRRAVGAGKRVWVLAGAVDVPAPPVGCTLRAISPPALPLDRALAATARNLRAATEALAAEL